MTTRRTQFRRREEPVHWKIGSAMPFRFVFQFAEYFGKCRVSNVLGKIRMFQHSDYVQSFDEDRLVFADDLRGELLNRISSDIADFGVQPGYSESGFLSIITVLDLARQIALKYSQPLFTPEEWARVFDLLAVAGRSKHLNTNVYTDFGFSLFESFNIGLNQDADEIAPTCVPADSQIEDFSVIRKRATPNNVERFGLLCQRDSTVSKGERIGSIASRLAMTPGFEFRILSSLLEKVCESVIEIAQRLLKNNRTDLGKKSFLRLLFPFGQFQRRIMVVNGFLALLPRFTTIVQSLIVNKASAAEGSGKLRGLLVIREEPVFEGLLYYHGYILLSMDAYCNTINHGRSAHDAKFISIQAYGYGWSILWRF